MTRKFSTSVLIVGAGPVGMTLALDLAWRGVDCLVVEQRNADEKPKPRANHVSARAMETYRRLGLAEEIRQAGLPNDYPTDVVWATSMNGYELTRIRLPSSQEKGAPGFVDSDWPTPEPQHKINQMYLEPILRRHAACNPKIRVLYEMRLETFVQNADQVIARCTETTAGEAVEIMAAYLIGCDGGSSGVRKAIGAKFTGDALLTRVVSLHVCAPDILQRLPNKPAHRYFIVNAQQMGSTVTLNGRDLWSFHVMLPAPDSDPAELDRDRAIRTMAGFERGFQYEIFSEDAWIGRRLLADLFRDGRVFICGDAAHIWVPNAGYGMNAGIADAENLAWRLAAVLHGWGGPALLEGYAQERRPITDQVSQFAKELSIKNRASEFRSPPAELTQNGEAGEAVRRRFGAALYEINLPQFTPRGLNFAYFYDSSPNIVYDGEPAPRYSVGDYTPSTVPGCRAPHFFRRDGSSLYDRLAADFTLLRLNPATDISSLLAAARQQDVPLAVLDIARDEAPAAYRHNLLLIRPDRHIAWRGNAAPQDAPALLRLIRGC